MLGDKTCICKPFFTGENCKFYFVIGCSNYILVRSPFCYLDKRSVLVKGRMDWEYVYKGHTSATVFSKKQQGEFQLWLSRLWTWLVSMRMMYIKFEKIGLVLACCFQGEARKLNITEVQRGRLKELRSGRSIKTNSWWQHKRRELRFYLNDTGNSLRGFK